MGLEETIVKSSPKWISKLREWICKKDRIISYDNDHVGIMVSLNVSEVKGFWVNYISNRDSAHLMVEFKVEHSSQTSDKMVAYGSRKNIANAYNSLNNQYKGK